MCSPFYLSVQDTWLRFPILQAIFLKIIAFLLCNMYNTVYLEAKLEMKRLKTHRKQDAILFPTITLESNPFSTSVRHYSALTAANFSPLTLIPSHS